MNWSRQSILACAVAMLAACGGGGDAVDDSADAAAVAGLEVAPVFHRVDLDGDPPREDALQTPAPPLPWQRRDLSSLSPDGSQPQATGGTVTYTPTQLRAAYDFPAWPLSWSGLSDTQAAAFGAGQTIYVVDAYHHPNLGSDLNAFNSQFGLPGCTLVAPTTLVALSAPPPSRSCLVQVAYSASGGAVSSRAPAYNASWAQEIALDVQWAHAVAPLARIVLVEAASASVGDLRSALLLVNKLAPGVVSMSFAAAEGSWVVQRAYSSDMFSTAGKAYFAATGDSGAGVNWPSVIASVVGVGGTTMVVQGGRRVETVWSGTGGGISRQVALPSYQAALPGTYTSARKRAVSDVSMVADPRTGVYVAFTSASARTPTWYAFGGTSLSTPLWAATAALANAQRALFGLPVMDTLPARLYQLAPAVPLALSDVTSGQDGSCSLCQARSGYDLPTGWGSPQTPALMSALAAGI